MAELVIRHAFQRPSLYDYLELDGTLEQTLAVLAEIRRRNATDQYRPVIDETSGQVNIEHERVSYSRDAYGKRDITRTWEPWAGRGDRIVFQGERGSYPSSMRPDREWQRMHWEEFDPENPVIDPALLEDKRNPKDAD